MRATSLAVPALAAALLLTACDSDGGGGNGGGSQDAKARSACQVGEVALQVGPANAAPAAGDTGNVPVTLTNRGDSACTLDGLPGVDLRAGDSSTALKPDEGAVPRKTALAKGATTSFTLTYVRGEEAGGKSLAAETAVIRLPGSAETHDFRWSYGAVALKSDGKTPDASVSGFQRSGD
ncbi:DUF4232 domain-containing protein [Streptomyces sp. NPDC007808]|uniref:DUF4232 domain-containing protein n=1 Tax=Streptomyces sp. NPDC007808 TaxID=3364779 RepID=UPI0036C986C2